ncbi:MAG TPA: hypothetical protein VJG90_04065 [Candidatus Nanoarchaeia archaeon]|nr:hypothetical protein [Candidatus Nanoarchaeia archaeon]
MNLTWLFDYDDTLVPCCEDYSQAQLDFVQWTIKTLGRKAPQASLIMSTYEGIDQGLVPFMGFTMERFPTAFRNAFQTICQKIGFPFSEEHLTQAYEIGMSVYNPTRARERGLLPGAAETLDFLLSQEDHLILVTKGDPRPQQPKIEATEMKRWFGDHIHVVPEKDAALFLRLLDGQEARNAWKVGNSIRSDVLPALEAGLNVAYIPHETWIFEAAHDGLPKHPCLHTFADILEIKERYDTLCTPNP